MFTNRAYVLHYLQTRRQQCPRTWRRWVRRSGTSSCVGATSRCYRQSWPASTPPSSSPSVPGWGRPLSGWSPSVTTPCYSSRPSGSPRLAVRSRWFRRGRWRASYLTCLLRKYRSSDINECLISHILPVCLVSTALLGLYIKTSLLLISFS